MKEESRIVELLAEMVYRQDVLIDEVKNIKEENIKTNLSIKELRLSVIRLADEIVVVHDHEKRISALEKNLKK